MQQYERNDVIVDQCTECGGLFLDRGELERLAVAEANYYSDGPPAPLPSRPARYERPRDDDRRYDDRRRTGYDDRYDRPGRKRKRESFFGEIFEMFGD